MNATVDVARDLATTALRIYLATLIGLVSEMLLFTLTFWTDYRITIRFNVSDKDFGNHR